MGWLARAWGVGGARAAFGWAAARAAGPWRNGGSLEAAAPAASFGPLFLIFAVSASRAAALALQDSVASTLGLAGASCLHVYAPHRLCGVFVWTRAQIKSGS